MTYYHALMCRGIGEKLGSNMLMGNGDAKGLTEYLRDIDGTITIHEVPWGASYGPAGNNFFGDSFPKDLAEGMVMISNILGSLPPNDLAVLCGYSGGAALVGNYAQLAGETMHRNKIAAVGLVADPLRPADAGVPGWHPMYGTFGLAGQREVRSDDFPVLWAADQDDPITSMDPDSLLRLFADVTYAVSFQPGQFPPWLESMAVLLAEKKFQKIRSEPWNLFYILNRAKLDSAAIYRYLWGGDHTRYAFRLVPNTDQNYLEHLACAIMNEIN